VVKEHSQKPGIDYNDTRVSLKSRSGSPNTLGGRVEFVKNEISLPQHQHIEENVLTFSFHKGNKVKPEWSPIDSKKVSGI
jgi:hypothetical protein